MTEATREALIDKHGESAIIQFTKELDLYGGNYKALTEQEARYVLEQTTGDGGVSLDTLRDRSLAERTPENRRILSEGVHGKTPLNKPENYIDPAEVSEVVDENGAPLVVYHGTLSDWDTYDMGRLGKITEDNIGQTPIAATAKIGIWTNSGIADSELGKKSYYNFKDLFVNIKNPRRMTLDKLFKEMEQIASTLEKKTGEDATTSAIADAWKEKNAKYDGLIVKDGEFGGISYVAFAPEQIKSATGNAGTFSEETGNINFQEESNNQSKPVKLADVVTIDPSVMVDETGKAIDLKNTSELRKWILNQYDGVQINIKTDNSLQVFRNDNLRASLKGRSKKHRSMYAGLDKLIENAVYTGDEKSDYNPDDSKTDKHKNIAKQNIYHVPARLGDKLYSVKLKVDVFNNAKENSYKHHAVTEIEITPTLYREIRASATSTQTVGAISKVNVEVLQGIVNPTRLEPDGKGGQILFQEAWHGTPHYIVDGFSTQNIGTGEGAQAFGWGLYFAENRKISEDYRRKLSNNDKDETKFKHKDWEGGFFLNTNAGIQVVNVEDNNSFWLEELPDDNPDKFAGRYFVEADYDTEKAISLFEETIENGEIEVSDDFKQEVTETINNMEMGEAGYLYKATVPDADELLDWDKTTVKQQGRALEVIQADEDFQRYIGGKSYYQGSAYYHYYEEKLGSPEAASKLLKEYGIKGIQYLDGNSRDDGEGTHNYVVFADEDIEIVDMLYQPDGGTDSADNHGMGEEQRREITEKLETVAVPMDKVEFTQENYEKLFPNGRIKTPLGEVKIGENQFKKLGNKDYGNRQDLLGAMHQTLRDPILVVEQTREQDNGRKSYLYAKSFTKKDGEHYNVIISVVVGQKEGENPINVSITTHRRDIKDIIKAIKNPEGIVYKKTDTSGQDSGDHDVNSSSSNEQHTTNQLSTNSSEKSSIKADDIAPLFQLTEAEILDEARQFSSWQQWRDYDESQRLIGKREDKVSRYIYLARNKYVRRKQQTAIS